MRDIKFRAWDKKRKEWVHKQACSILGETILLCGWMQRPNGHHVRLEELNDIEVQQYTGLKDKNGVEIYEGDIVATKNSKYKVVFDKCCFWGIDEMGKYPIYQISHYIMDDERFEVIGNIYENPELLN